MINDAKAPAANSYIKEWSAFFDKLKDEDWTYCSSCNTIYIECSECWMASCTCAGPWLDCCRPTVQLIQEVVKNGPPKWYNKKLIQLEDAYWESRNDYYEPWEYPEPEPTVLDLIIEECDKPDE